MKKLLIALGVVIVLLVAAVAVVEIGGRPVAQDYIRNEIVKALPGTDPEVTIGPGSLVLQAIAGHLDKVDVTVPDATIGTFTSDLTLSATDVPLDSTAPLGTLDIGVDANAAEVQELVQQLDGLEKATVAIDGDVNIASSFSVLGLTVPFGFGVAPTADQGALVLTPTTVSLNNATLSLADVAKAPFGTYITGLVKPQRICVSEYLPKVLTLTGARVTGSSLHLNGEADGISLGSTDFTVLGSC